MSNSISFLLMDFVLLVLAISFIFVVFDLHGLSFVFEFGILLILLFFLAFGMYSAYQDKKWGWALIGVVLFLISLNTFTILLLKNAAGASHLSTILASVVGIVIALVTLILGNQGFDSSVAEAG